MTCIQYDPAGNPQNVTDAMGHITAFEHDARNRPTRRIDPLLNEETYTYDPNGNPRFIADRNGQTIEFQYDPANRLSTKILLPGLPGETITQIAYNAINNVTTMTEADSTLTFTHDGTGRLLTASTTGSPGQPDVTLAYTYDKTATASP